MKVAWFSDTFEQNNGVATYLQETLPVLSKKINVTLYTGRVTKEYPFPTVSLNYVEDPLLPSYDVVVPPVKPVKCDVAHAHSQYSLGVFASQFKVPKVVTAHFVAGHFLEFFFKSAPVPKFLEDAVWAYEIWLLNSFDRVVCQTAAGKDMFRKLGLKRKVEVIANGINLDNYPSADGSRFRRKYGIAEPFALFIGRLDASKQPHWVVEVARRLPQMQFIISGAGTLEAELRKGAPPNVLFYGRLPRQDLLDCYNAAFALLMPSLVETEGLVAQEAMACGTPVLISDLDILKEVVGSGGIACSNSLDMYDKLKTLLDNPERQKELSAKAVEEVAKRDINISVRKLVSLYESLL
ncbi:MAG: glycosyltransferase [Candidatus Micrarchaeota archaeon]